MYIRLEAKFKCNCKVFTWNVYQTSTQTINISIFNIIQYISIFNHIPTHISYHNISHTYQSAPSCFCIWQSQPHLISNDFNVSSRSSSPKRCPQQPCAVRQGVAGQAVGRHFRTQFCNLSSKSKIGVSSAGQAGSHDFDKWKGTNHPGYMIMKL